MDINIGVLIVTLAVLVIQTELSYRRIIDDFKKMSSEAMEVLFEAERKNKISDQEYENKADEIERQLKFILKKEWIFNSIKLSLPILITLEVGHITLQEFQWYEQIQRIPSGLNKYFLLFIIALILIYFIEEIIIRRKFPEYKQEIMSIVLRYKLNRVMP